MLLRITILDLRWELIVAVACSYLSINCARVCIIIYDMSMFYSALRIQIPSINPAQSHLKVCTITWPQHGIWQNLPQPLGLTICSLLDTQSSDIPYCASCNPQGIVPMECQTLKPQDIIGTEQYVATARCSAQSLWTPVQLRSTLGAQTSDMSHRVSPPLRQACCTLLKLDLHIHAS